MSNTVAMRSALPKPLVTNEKSMDVPLSLKPLPAERRRSHPRRGGSNLRVAKALKGKEAVEVLIAAGVLTPKGKHSRAYR